MHHETPLSRFHLDAPRLSAEDLIRHKSGDATRLAWANGFGREEVRQALRTFVLELFAARLPQGKSVWGFKEIRYGPEGLPEFLLELFPEAKIIYCSRRSTATVESSLAAWNADVLARTEQGDGGYGEKLRDLASQNYARWLSYTHYFKQLSVSRPDSVMLARIETLETEFPHIVAFLGLQATATEDMNLASPLNDNRRGASLLGGPRVRRTLDAVRLAFAQQLRAVEADIGYAN